MRKKIIVILISSFLVLSNSVLTIQAQAKSIIEISSCIDSQDDYIEPKADKIGWRYKVQNGILYKRQYNYTRERWIGDWIPCD